MRRHMHKHFELTRLYKEKNVEIIESPVFFNLLQRFLIFRRNLNVEWETQVLFFMQMLMKDLTQFQ